MDEMLADNSDPLVVRDKHVFIRGPVIKVNVGSGDSKQEFAVHRDLFENRFTKYCEPEVDFETGVLDLEREDPRIFELYVQHLYTGDIPCRQTMFSSAMSYDYQNSMLVKFFALAETLYDETAMHSALQAFLWSFRRLQTAGKRAAPSMDIVRHVYEVTCEESPLRRLLVDMYIWDGHWFNSMYTWLPELIRDIAKVATKKWKYETGTDESEHAVCCDYFNSSNKCRTRKEKCGEDDGELARKRKKAREETPDDELV